MVFVSWAFGKGKEKSLSIKRNFILLKRRFRSIRRQG
jgi:hypothetical protein